MAVAESAFGDMLKLDEKWSVLDVAVDKENETTHIYVGTERGETFPCPVCGRQCKAHDYQERVWRDLDMGSFRCEVHAGIPRTVCPEHGIKQVNVPWAREFSRHTRYFEKRCFELIREMPLNAASRIMRVSDDMLWSLVTAYVNGAMSRIDLSKVKRIGIDETSCRRGHDYISLFIDLDSGDVVFATPGKDSGTIGSFIVWLKEHGGDAGNITDVSCDMSPAFIKGITENFPDAEITFDKFHVLKMVNEAIDGVRREEHSKNAGIVNVRYALLRRPENLKEGEKERLEDILKDNTNIMLAYGLKESMWTMYRLDSYEDAKKHMELWLSQTEKMCPKPFMKFADTVRSHLEGILRWHVSKISNGILEGTNSVIQAVKRMARGYKKTENMISMIYLRSAGISI
jgi:transposase